MQRCRRFAHAGDVASAAVAPLRPLHGRARMEALHRHMQSDQQGPAVAVLACGTRGDVQPLLALSIALKEGLGGCCDATLITHSAHQASRLHPRSCKPCRWRHERQCQTPQLEFALMPFVGHPVQCRHGCQVQHALQGCSCASCSACRPGGGTAQRRRAVRCRCASLLFSSVLLVCKTAVA